MNYIRETLKELDRLEETRFSKGNRDRHYNIHVAKNYYDYFTDMSDELLDPMSPEEYDDYADELSKMPVRTSDINSPDNIVGYVTTDDRIVKYNKKTNELVVYKATKDDAATISFYKTAGPGSYLRKIKRDYGREIVPEDDYYNR